jgi:hypothetical protein
VLNRPEEAAPAQANVTKYDKYGPSPNVTKGEKWGDFER